MIKKILLSSVAALVLSACQTATEVQRGAAGGMMNTISCPQIQSTFAAYEMDKNSYKALMDIATMTGANISGVTASSAGEYYETAKASANVALLVQGCPPLQ